MAKSDNLRKAKEVKNDELKIFDTLNNYDIILYIFFKEKQKMLQSTLCSALDCILHNFQLSEYQQKQCREFFSMQKINDYIYAGHLKSKICVDIKIAYQILEELKGKGFLYYRR